jgi:lipoate-protein ligase A
LSSEALILSLAELAPMSQASSKRLLNVIRTTGMAILDQLRLEEALLRNTKINWLVINDGTVKPAVVLGISGDPHKLVHIDSAREAGVPLVKRFSGGGTVVVDKNTVFVTMIMNHADLQYVDPFPRPIMEFTGEVCFCLL